MNRTYALKILGIREDDEDADLITEYEIKKRYRAKALEFHPDKNASPDASARFIEVKEAYSFLINVDHDVETEIDKSYNDLLNTFLSSIFREECHTPIVAKIVELICKKMCVILEHNADHIIEYLRNINHNTLKTIYDVLSKYRGVFHFSSDIFEKIEDILRAASDSKFEVDEYIVLNPTLTDLMAEENIYILKYLDRFYLVPLWQHELVFDVSGQSLAVKNFPILPDNMELDEWNNLTVRLNYNLREIWGRDVVEEIGGRSFVINGDMLKLTSEPQHIEYYGSGVPFNNGEDIMNASQKQSIVFIITVLLDDPKHE